jgi:sortase A
LPGPAAFTHRWAGHGYAGFVAAPVVLVGQHLVQIGGETFAQWDVPTYHAVGWQAGSLGEPDNVVLNGHHNADGEVFRDLVKLQPGDLIRLDSGGRRYWYQVAQTMVLAEEGQPVEARQANARWILPTDDERVTLITCWPYESNTHRLVVIALPVPLPGAAAK